MSVGRLWVTGRVNLIEFVLLFCNIRQAQFACPENTLAYSARMLMTTQTPLNKTSKHREQTVVKVLKLFPL
jgi:hypothetical protein